MAQPLVLSPLVNTTPPLTQLVFTLIWHSVSFQSVLSEILSKADVFLFLYIQHNEKIQDAGIDLPATNILRVHWITEQYNKLYAQSSESDPACTGIPVKGRQTDVQLINK